MIAACELAPPATETAPTSPASASSIRSAGLTSRRTRMKSPAGRGAAGLAEPREDGVRRPAGRRRPARPSRGWPAPRAPRPAPRWPAARPSQHHRRRGRRPRRGRRRGVGRDQPPDLDDGRFLIAPGVTQPFRQRESLRGYRRERVPDLLRRGADRRFGVGDVQGAQGDALGDGQPPEPHRHQLIRSAAARRHAARARISAVNAAPGSSCPTLRGPR